MKRNKPKKQEFWVELDPAPTPMATVQEMVEALHEGSKADPMGSWTGNPTEPGETPQQDADDL